MAYGTCTGEGNSAVAVKRMLSTALVAVAVAVGSVVGSLGVGLDAASAHLPVSSTTLLGSAPPGDIPLETATPNPTPPPVAVAPPQLGLTAIGQGRGFFDVTISPGENLALTAQLSNPSEASITGRSYRADVYSLLNGGFGSRTGADPISGATNWVDYPGGPVTVAAGKTRDQPFTVSVPPGTPPGEYLSSIVAESGAISPEAIAAGATQILRTVVAVSIRVPGDLSPAVTIGAATQEQSGAQTTVAIALNNTGNARLKPQVRLAVNDSGGNELYVREVSMDSFYATTSTGATAILPVALPAGRYRVSVTVSDSSAKLESITAVRGFTVPGEVTVHPTKSAPAASGDSAPSIVIPVGVGVLVLGGIALLIHRRRARLTNLARDTPSEH